MNRPLRAVFVTAVLTCLPLPACGPDFSPPEFVRRREPDDPARFLAGHLDVISPRLKTAWQVAAWRRLAGLPAGAFEAYLARPENVEDRDPWTAVNAWKEARQEILPAAGGPPISTDRYVETTLLDDEGEPYTDTIPYLNCPADAFATAKATLADRKQRFPAQVARWVVAQDAVFAACGDDEAPAVAEPEADLAAPLAADRRYQLAAASFYAGRFDEARGRFLAIAKDGSSPWSGIAPYLATRALVRQISLSPSRADPGRFKPADEELAALLADPDRAAWHEAARRLRSWVAIRSRPAERRAELGKTLSGRDLDAATVGDALQDYAYLLEHHGRTETTDPLTEWIEVFGAPSPEGAAQAVGRWRAERSLPWLVAALTLAPADGKAPADLLQAATDLTSDSPAKATASFHRARLLIAGGQSAEARGELDRLLAGDLSLGSENLAKSLRLRVAGSLDDLVADGLQQRLTYPGDEEESANEAKATRYLTGEAAFWWNTRLPLDSFGATVERVKSPEVKERVAEAAWTRALLLDDTAEAERAARTIGTAVPEIAAWAAAAPADRPSAAAWALINNPGLAPMVESGFPRGAEVEEIDSYRRNWWCAEMPSEVASDERNDDLPGLPAAPPFLSAADRAAAEREGKALEALGEGYDVIARRVLAWAKERPADPKVPEALYLASQRARYANCRQEKPNLSKATFDLLKKSYPQSEWAKVAKYWY